MGSPTPTSFLYMILALCMIIRTLIARNRSFSEIRLSIFFFNIIRIEIVMTFFLDKLKNVFRTVLMFIKEIKQMFSIFCIIV